MHCLPDDAALRNRRGSVIVREMSYFKLSLLPRVNPRSNWYNRQCTYVDRCRYNSRCCFVQIWPSFSSSDMWRLHIYLRNQCHKEALRVHGRDGADHQEVCGRRQNRRNNRQGTFASLIKQFCRIIFVWWNFNLLQIKHNMTLWRFYFYFFKNRFWFLFSQIYRPFLETSRKSKRSLSRKRKPRNQVVIDTLRQ